MVRRQQIAVQKQRRHNLVCLHGVVTGHQLQIARRQRMLRVQARVRLFRLGQFVIAKVINLPRLNFQRSIGNQAQAEGVQTLQPQKWPAHGNMPLTRFYFKPGVAVVADIEVMMVINIDTGRLDLIGRPLGMGPVEIQQGVVLVPLVVVDMHKVVAGNRVQKCPHAFTDRLVNRAAGQHHHTKQCSHWLRGHRSRPQEGTRIFIVVCSSSLIELADHNNCQLQEMRATARDDYKPLHTAGKAPARTYWARNWLTSSDKRTRREVSCEREASIASTVFFSWASSLRNALTSASPALLSAAFSKDPIRLSMPSSVSFCSCWNRRIRPSISSSTPATCAVTSASSPCSASPAWASSATRVSTASTSEANPARTCSTCSPTPAIAFSASASLPSIDASRSWCSSSRFLLRSLAIAQSLRISLSAASICFLLAASCSSREAPRSCKDSPVSDSSPSNRASASLLRRAQ